MASAEVANGNAVIGVISRFSRTGFTGKLDLANDSTAFAHYEFGAGIANTCNDGGILKTRLSYAAIKDDYGSFRFSKDHHKFYNFNVGTDDIPWKYSDFAIRH
ncbi:MAG: putative porin [Enterobacterales bacterium]|jgi:predicted porin